MGSSLAVAVEGASLQREGERRDRENGIVLVKVVTVAGESYDWRSGLNSGGH